MKKRVYVCPEASCVHHDPSRVLADRTFVGSMVISFLRCYIFFFLPICLLGLLVKFLSLSSTIVAFVVSSCSSIFN